MPARKTAKSVSAWVSSRHFCRSIQSRCRYQSSSLAEQVEHLLRAAHDHEANHQPPASRSGRDPIFVDQAAEQIPAPDVEPQDRDWELA
jgi:hypothetical protein